MTTTTAAAAARRFGYTDPDFLSKLLTRNASERCRAATRIADEIQEQVSKGHRDLRVIFTVQRLASECPFQDVRKIFTSLCEVIGIPSSARPISAFLPERSIPKMANMKAGSLLDFYQESFLHLGRVRPVDQLISMLPSFVLTFFKSYDALMYGEGPLLLFERNYLAIMAGARQRCRYIVKSQESEFLMNGGPPTWLSRPDTVPKKFQQFYLLNAYMTHQPWKITTESVSDILSGEVSISELVHAVVVLSTFQSLCGFCFGLGLLSDIKPDAFKDTKPVHDDTNTLALLLRTSLDELLLKISDSGNTDAEDSLSGVWADSHDAVSDSLFCHYVGNVASDLQYEDFNVKSKEYKLFHVNDFEFKEQGYSLLSRYWHEHGALLLDEEFDLIYNISDRTFSGDICEVDTGPFRRAIWHYTLRLFGVLNDAYNYQEVNIFLNKSIKLYIKSSCCHAPDLTKEIFDGIGYNLRPDEIVHVALLTMEARRQAILLYCLRALPSR